MQQPEDRQPDEPVDTGADAEAAPAPSEDDVWASIVAHYGDRPAEFPDAEEIAEPEPEPEPSSGPARSTPAASTGVDASVFDRTYLDSQRLDPDSGELSSAATWDDEGHFVPPEPPPLPVLEPRRRAAWAALVGSPLLMLAAVLFRWSYPAFFLGLLVIAFVSGFVYLVATMPRGRSGGPDDGAVV